MSDTGKCIPWMGALDRDGYGRLSNAKLAHRIAYENAIGPIPDGLVIDHLCRNRRCVNPEHMETVTIRENTLRGQGPAAQNAKKVFCVNGHKFTDANTYWRPTKYPTRQCRACNAASAAAYKAKNRSLHA